MDAGESHDAERSAGARRKSRRAPGMSQAERRAMIVRAALPLLAEFGASVTTSQIARAVGIGEATIFRAFAGKDELLDACVAEAMRPDNVLAELAAIPLDQPLAARLTAAAAAMKAHLDRMGTVIGALYASGRTGRGRDPSGAVVGRGRASAHADGGRGRAESADRTRDALAALFEPDRASLRTSPRRLATLFMGLNLIFTGPRAPTAPGEPEITIEELVDTFLNGVVVRETP